MPESKNLEARKEVFGNNYYRAECQNQGNKKI